jgi:hypothetical protein
MASARGASKRVVVGGRWDVRCDNFSPPASERLGSDLLRALYGLGFEAFSGYTLCVGWPSALLSVSAWG